VLERHERSGELTLRAALHAVGLIGHLTPPFPSRPQAAVRRLLYATHTSRPPFRAAWPRWCARPEADASTLAGSPPEGSVRTMTSIERTSGSSPARSGLPGGPSEEGST